MKNKIFGDLNLNKMLYCSLGFVLFCAFLILIFIIPTLKAYQNTNLRLSSQNTITRNVAHKFNQSEQRLSKLQNDNKQIFAHFDAGFKEADLSAFLKQFFDDVKLEKIYPLKADLNAIKTFKGVLQGAKNDLASDTKNNSLENSLKNSGANNNENFIENINLSNNAQNDNFIDENTTNSTFTSNNAKNNIAQNEPYLLSKYQISATLNDPKNFYAFIDTLKNYQNILKINLPINLQAQNQHIKIDFNLKVYSSNAK